MKKFMAKIFHKPAKPPRPNYLTIILFVMLLFYVVSLLIPMLWGLITSAKSPSEYTILGNVLGWPNSWSWNNYSTAYKYFYVEVYTGGQTLYYGMMTQFGNSLLYAIGCALASTLVPCITAYAIARFRFKFGKFVYALVVVAMALPIVGALPSEIQVVKALGLFDSFVGLYILKANFLSLYFLIFYAQFQNIPNDYTEAAKIDGASNFRIMTTVMMPMVAGTIFTVFLLNFITYWNDYQTPMIYLPTHPVVSYGMFVFQNSLTQELDNTPTKLAGIFLMALPILIIFLLLHKKLLVSVDVGGIKG